jgi:hypothetical protein
MIEKSSNLSFNKFLSSNLKSLSFTCHNILDSKNSNEYTNTRCNTTNIGFAKILTQKYSKAHEQSTQSHPPSSSQVTSQCDGLLVSTTQLLGTLVSKYLFTCNINHIISEYNMEKTTIV